MQVCESVEKNEKLRKKQKTNIEKPVEREYKCSSKYYNMHVRECQLYILEKEQKQ